MRGGMHAGGSGGLGAFAVEIIRGAKPNWIGYGDGYGDGYGSGYGDGYGYG